jgi:hypothetical protein
MDDLGLEPASAALIWSEGAVFTVGTQKALAHWWPILKPGGYVAFSDLAWVSAARPPEAATFFDACYASFVEQPGMPDAIGLFSIAARIGYRLEAHFVLPASDWGDEYHAGVKARIDGLRDRDNAVLRELIATLDKEMDLVSRYASAFGYVFTILSKPE